MTCVVLLVGIFLLNNYSNLKLIFRVCHNLQYLTISSGKSFFLFPSTNSIHVLFYYHLIVIFLLLEHLTGDNARSRAHKEHYRRPFTTHFSLKCNKSLLKKSPSNFTCIKVHLVSRTSKMCFKSLKFAASFPRSESLE